jgi:hypothetical protein
MGIKKLIYQIIEQGQLALLYYFLQPILDSSVSQQENNHKKGNSR